jgi:hypothetical protein
MLSRALKPDFPDDWSKRLRTGQIQEATGRPAQVDRDVP